MKYNPMHANLIFVYEKIALFLSYTINIIFHLHISLEIF